MAAQNGNRNAIKTGVHSYMSTGRLPPGCSYVTRLINRMRGQLEAAVGERHGEVDVYRAAVVQSACRHESRCILLQRYLREASDELSVTDRATLLREMSNATTQRDRCLKQAGLDQTDADHALAALYGPQTPTNVKRDSSVIDTAARPSEGADGGQTEEC